MYYGVRGGAGLTVTVFGARNDLHSGNYGNWAPDPSMRLARLLVSMKDDTGRVTIKGFYDDVTPLTPTELKAIDEMPNVEAALKKDFLVAQPERGGAAARAQAERTDAQHPDDGIGRRLQRGAAFGDPGIGGGAHRDASGARARPGEAERAWSSITFARRATSSSRAAIRPTTNG